MQAWPVGTFATRGTKVGRTTMAPDTDAEVKLCWADGNGTSGYVKVEALTRVTKSAWDAAQKAVRFLWHWPSDVCSVV